MRRAIHNCPLIDLVTANVQADRVTAEHVAAMHYMQHACISFRLATESYPLRRYDLLKHTNFSSVPKILIDILMRKMLNFFKEDEFKRSFGWKSNHAFRNFLDGIDEETPTVLHYYNFFGGKA
jgi:hypothetical protein